MKTDNDFRAELDAYYARLYGLTRDGLRYTPIGVDPKEVYGEDFLGETFRVLKEKEIRQFGEYRTRRLVLEAWDNLEGIPISSGQPAMVPAPVKEESKYEVSAALEVLSVREEAEPVEEEPVQPMLSDFGLYKCQACGKMVMGYEKEKHAEEKHVGKSVEWRKMR